MVKCIDKNGFAWTTGGDNVNCFAINEKYGTIIPSSRIEVFDLNNGCYEVCIKPDESGIFAVYVLINGKELGGCPYILDVTPGPPHS